MKESIRELRIKIDGLSQLVKELKPCKQLQTTVQYPSRETVTYIHNELFDGKPLLYNSIEINKAVDSLILAKAWLGKILGELGEATPYANDGNRKDVKDIEPTADKNLATIEELTYENCIANCSKDYLLLNHIQKVDWLRQEIQHIIHLVEQAIHTGNQSREFAIARTNSYNHLCEARFWLGFELSRCKDAAEK